VQPAAVYNVNNYNNHHHLAPVAAAAAGAGGGGVQHAAVAAAVYDDDLPVAGAKREKPDGRKTRRTDWKDVVSDFPKPVTGEVGTVCCSPVHGGTHVDVPPFPQHNCPFFCFRSPTKSAWTRFSSWPSPPSTFSR